MADGRVNRWDLLVAAVAIVLQLTMVAAVADPPANAVPVVGFVLLGASTAVLALRRWFPVGTWAATVVATALYGHATWPDPPVYVGAVVALFTVALLCPLRRAIVVGVSSVALVPIAAALDPAEIDVNDVLTPLLFVALTWLVGRHLATQRENILLLRDRAARLEQEREAETAQALRAERLRIARELHDTTAHHVSVISVQAQVAAADPAQTESALSSIASSARAALSDLRRMLGVLRDGSDGAGRRPQPTLAELGELVGPVEAAGLDVSCSIDPGAPALADDVQLTVYRIIQEGLTNAVRHSGAGHVDIDVALRPDGVEVRIADDGKGPSVGRRDGHGLEGMRERARIYGGSLTTRTGPTGGFVVEVVLRP